LKNGKVSINDYYDMQNIQADTDMRNSISEKNKDSISATKPSRPPRV